MKRAIVLCIALVALLMLAMPVLAAPQPSSAALEFSLTRYLLAWLWPVGVALVLVGISEGWSINDVAAMLPLALALAVLCELLCGYALHYGGAALGAEWEPFGPGWGLLGSAGWLVSADAVTAELLYDLPRLTVALLAPLVVLRGRGRPWLRYTVAMACGLVLAPVAGNWVDGGGWLQNLGAGLVDVGLVSLPLVATLATLGVSLALARPEGLPADDELRPAFLPLHVLLGSMLAWVGWLALIGQGEGSMAGAAAALCAVAGALLLSAFYSWLIDGLLDPGLMGRGLLAGLVMTGAMPADGLALPTAFVLGALGGLALAPLMHVFDRSLRLREQSGLLAIFGVLGAVALLVPGLVGSSGILAGPGQLYVQLVGLAALVVWGGGVPWALTTLFVAAAAWPGLVRARVAREQAALEDEPPISETPADDSSADQSSTPSGV
ncbi:MAG: hypothetical protein ABFD20_06180 [Anaerolineales bacterium]